MTWEDGDVARSDRRSPSFLSSASGRACLNDWAQPLTVSDILSLLLDLKRAVAIAGAPVILLAVIRQSVPAPANFLINCLQATVPAILDCCEELVIVVEGADLDRAPLRNAFVTDRRTATKRTPPRLFESLSAAFAHAQHLAPHDVLELQRQLLHQSLPPNGKLL
jgi:hypothetical protein